MATPNLKILLNALRLGQPQDPKAVAFVLAEAISAQDDTIEDLRRKLGMAQQLAQVLEAKTTRLESEIESLRALLGGAPHSQAPHSQPVSSPQARVSHGHRSSYPEAYPEAYSEAYADRSASSHRPASQPPPAMHRSQPPPAPDAPPSGSAGLRLRRDRRPEFPSVDALDDSVDEFKTETVVVRQRDVLAAHLPEAPFQITPAGQRVPHSPPHSPSIPGAPWARDRGHSVPVPMDEFTVDAMPREPSEDLEGETHHDRGSQEALRNLGITGSNPNAGSSRGRPRTTPRIPEDENPRPGSRHRGDKR